LLDIDIWI